MNVTNVLDYMGYRSLELSHRIKGHQVHPPDSWARYIADDPNEMLRITYPLDEWSLVLDVGGFKGEWAQRLYSRYCCKIHIFEPHPVLWKIAYDNFRHNPDVYVYPFGWGDKNGTMMLYGDDIYASLDPNEYECGIPVQIRKASEVLMQDYAGSTIDLLKLNIEGSEYAVLPDLIKNNLIPNIKNIQIQFHNTVPGYKEKRALIQQCLSATHKQVWCYDYLYESWTLK